MLNRDRLGCCQPASVHSMLRGPGDMSLRMPRQQRSLTGVRVTRILMILMILIGLLLAGIALGVFLTQGSQIRMTANVLSERCHPQRDLGTGQVETRCDAAVRFMTVTGRVILTTVTDAFPYEFSGPRQSRTIDLRYDSNDPTQPFKQSNYMPAVTFVVLLVFGCAAILFGVWGVMRSGQLAERAARRRSGRF